MSDHSSQDRDGIDFNERTTKYTFNERLLKAQKSNTEAELVNRISFDDFYTSDDTEKLRQQLAQLQIKTKKMEDQVIEMQNKLTVRKERRRLEASLTNMTPEERADYVMKQEQEQEKTPDLDIIFEYLLLLETSSLDSANANDLSNTDFIKPNADIRKKALANEMVASQEEYSTLHFTNVNNILDSNTADQDEIRHCELSGTSFNNEFSVSFDVSEPSMVMSNLTFHVGFELELEIGQVLEKAREECNIMAFFRILGHYGLLEKERKQVFDNLIETFKDTQVHIELLSPSRLKFEGSTNVYLILEYRTSVSNIDLYRLDANATDHIQPMLSLDAFNLPSEDLDSVTTMNRMNDVFMELVKKQGLYNATKTIMNKIFVI